MMIYAALSATGGNIENVYGHRMRVRTIDASDKDLAETLQAEGWKSKADDVIEQIETEKLEAENKVMKDKLSGGKDDKRVAELEAQLAEALTEIAGLEETVTELKDKVEVYESGKDVNGNGKIDYNELDKPMLQKLLDKRGVKYVSRDGLKELIQKAQDSE